MNWMQIVFQSVGGLGLFLMGMKFMSEGMQKTAGGGLRKTLNFLTRNRFMAIFIGFLITAVIQSSSATTVMVVGFVNAGLMGLKSAIGVILGANVGTTVTGWIVSLKVVKFAMPLIGLGVFFKFFGKSEKWKYIGEVIFGFGILFLGMQTMKMGFAPLRESAAFLKFFTMVDGTSFTSVLLGVLIGTITTLMVQSSSAILGISIALASQGILNFGGAVSIILGTNIGTTVTAMLACIGTNFHAKRAAAAHTLFNVIGVVFALVLFYPFTALVEAIVPHSANMLAKTAEQAAALGVEVGASPYIGPHIAMAHTIFNFANVILFIPLVPILAKICERLIPEPAQKKKQRAVHFSHIDFNLIETPALGIAETEKELMVMAQQVRKSAELVKELINNGTDPEKLCDKVLKTEKIVDEYQKYITEFLVQLSSSALSESDAYNVGNYMTLSHNLEKYADHLEHIALNMDKINRKNIDLPDVSRKNIDMIYSENLSFFDNSFEVFTQNIDSLSFMDKSQVINRRIKKLIKEAKMAYFVGAGKNHIDSNTALVYLDILNYLDGMRAQAYNIAEVTSGTKYQS